MSFSEATVNDTELRILKLCSEKQISRKQILDTFGHHSFSGNMKQALKHLKRMGFIDHTIENKPTSKNQQYKITSKGKDLLKNKQIRKSKKSLGLQKFSIRILKSLTLH